jgi:hypothetical protein
MESQQPQTSDETKPMCGFIYVDNAGRKRKCRNQPLTLNGHCKVHNHSTLIPFVSGSVVNTDKNNSSTDTSAAEKPPKPPAARYQQLTINSTSKSKVWILS